MARAFVGRWWLAAAVFVVLGNAGIASAGAATTLSVSTTPSAFPNFDPSVSDYVIRGCPSTGGVPVSVTTDPGQYVSVQNQTPQTGTFTATANVTTGQEFSVVETNGGTTTGTWYMRCLPSDFPDFTSSVTGTPQAQYFLTAATQPKAANGYISVFDDNGVPVWWYPADPGVDFATNTPSDTGIAWTSTDPNDGTDPYVGEPVPVVTLSGQPVKTISSPDGPVDLHEIQPLGLGYVLVIVDETKCCTDLSSWGSGFPSNASIADPVIEELSPQNRVVWSWDPLAHINPAVETSPQWYSFLQANGSPYDVFHMNSLSYSKGALLVSMRHLDAVYGINVMNGSIFMKIGGHQDPQSYTVQNDPVFSAGGTFCGQHDARVLSDGTITVHDNGTGCGRAPRGVHYSINPSNQTATLLGSVTDPRAPSSFCCGSARLLSGGDWVASWGGNPLFTELTASGSPVYTVNWTDPGAFAYRVTPITPGTWTAGQLRNGMNAQYPSAGAAARRAAALRAVVRRATLRRGTVRRATHHQRRRSARHQRPRFVIPKT